MSKVLSIRQPWAHAIVHLGKRIENRRWNTTYRGDFLTHAAKGMTRGEYDDACDFIANVRGDWLGRSGVPTFEKIERGGIIGRARITDCLAPHRLCGDDRDRWRDPEQYGILLDDVQALPFVPCKGALGLWEFDYEAARSKMGTQP